MLEADPRTGLVVAAADGALRLTELQPAGKSKMEATAFVRGNPIPVGSRFGRSP